MLGSAVEPTSNRGLFEAVGKRGASRSVSSRNKLFGVRGVPMLKKGEPARPLQKATTGVCGPRV